jgi:hypothetical protein
VVDASEQALSDRLGRLDDYLKTATTTRRPAVTQNRHGSAAIEFPNDLEIVVTREFDAPIELVFDVSTKPEHVQKTIAPFEEEVTECSIDLRVGGNYRFVFVTDDGTVLVSRNLPGGRAADPDRPDVAVRRVAGCGGRRVDGPARD